MGVKGRRAWLMLTSELARGGPGCPMWLGDINAYYPTQGVHGAAGAVKDTRRASVRRRRAEIRSSTGPIVGGGSAAVFHLPENFKHTYTGGRSTDTRRSFLRYRRFRSCCQVVWGQDDMGSRDRPVLSEGVPQAFPRCGDAI